MPPKHGAMLLTGGAAEFDGQFMPAEMMLLSVFGYLGISCDDVIEMSDTDRVTLAQRPDLQQQLTDLAQLWNERGGAPCAK